MQEIRDENSLTAMIAKFVSAGEDLREKGDFAEAERQFAAALYLADTFGLPVMSVNIRMHRLLIWKSLEKTSIRSPLRELTRKEYGEIRAAYRTVTKNELNGQPKALVFMRWGGYHADRGDWDKAEEKYSLALRELGTRAPEYCEYLRNHGLSLVMCGETSAGLIELSRAEGLLLTGNKYRGWRKQVVLCGILTAQYRAYKKVRDKKKAAETFGKAMKLANRLQMGGRPQPKVNLQSFK